MMNAKAHLRWCQCWFWWDTAANHLCTWDGFFSQTYSDSLSRWYLCDSILPSFILSPKKKLKISLVLQYLHLLGNPCLFSPFEKSPPQEMKNPLLRAWQIWFFCQGGTPTESMSRKAMMKVMTIVTRGTICGKLSEPCWFYGFRKYHSKVDHKNLGS